MLDSVHFRYVHAIYLKNRKYYIIGVAHAEHWNHDNGNVGFPLQFLTKFRIPHPGSVGGRFFINIAMPLVLSWVPGGTRLVF